MSDGKAGKNREEIEIQVEIAQINCKQQYNSVVNSIGVAVSAAVVSVLLSNTVFMSWVLQNNLLCLAIGLLTVPFIVFIILQWLYNCRCNKAFVEIREKYHLTQKIKSSKWEKLCKKLSCKKKDEDRKE
ncbi:MAG: hypothetical protein LBE76_07360 [Nitrososphaerota archaeon]|jgi:hypothetical protein|nr:hypothetical protein [Nitrososphaerota archaeon]